MVQDETQMVQHLPGKPEDLSSNRSDPQMMLSTFQRIYYQAYGRKFEIFVCLFLS
jgi:hypothetical protein